MRSAGSDLHTIDGNKAVGRFAFSVFMNRPFLIATEDLKKSCSKNFEWVTDFAGRLHAQLLLLSVLAGFPSHRLEKMAVEGTAIQKVRAEYTKNKKKLEAFGFCSIQSSKQGKQ